MASRVFSGESGMRVSRSHHAELIRIRAELLFKFKTVLKGLAGILVLEHLVGLGYAKIEVALVPGAIVGELVVRGEEWVGLTVAFDLGHLVERFPAEHAHQSCPHIAASTSRDLPD